MADIREEFQRLLENTYIPTVGDKEEIGIKLNDFLNTAFQYIPDKLYRYRKCDKNSIDSFQNGTIYVCNAECFSDKYDSRVFVDRQRINREMKTYMKDALTGVVEEIKKGNTNIVQEKASMVCYWMACGLSDEEIVDKIIAENYDSFIKETEEGMKAREWRFRSHEKSAQLGCFTESVQSKFMWDHYADGYTGFALEYNMKELLYKFMGKGPLFTFPVIYTDKMPDVTNEEAIAYYIEKCKKEGWMKCWAPLYQAIPTNAMHSFKPYLYKDKEEYSHEREWRMVYYEDNEQDFALIPDMDCLKAIYYGPDISSDNKSKLHEIAVRRGIAEYDVAFDLESRNYKLKIND